MGGAPPGMRRILLTGATGLLGRELWGAFAARDRVLAVSRRWRAPVPRAGWRRADLWNPAALRRLVRAFRPDWVVHAAAIPNVDACEADSRSAFETNVLGTRHLLQAAGPDVPFVYISTDQVFDGSRARGYREEDLPSPPNAYGLSKLWGERQALALARRAWVVRTGWLFGPGGSHFAGRLLAGEPLKAAADWVACPTAAADLARAVDRLTRGAPPGIYHLTNGPAASRWDVARELARLAPGRVRAVRSRFSELKLPAPRPQSSVLINAAWRRLGRPPLRPWREALADYVRERGMTSASRRDKI